MCRVVVECDNNSFQQMCALRLHVKELLLGGNVTAEIAIINRSGIALAADSAVTVGRDRVWKYANKLFSLGPHHDVGVMIYNSGDLIGLPWEIIIKEYRKNCHNKSFDTVKECADDFINFISGPTIENKKLEEFSIIFVILDYISKLKRKMKFKTKTQFLSALNGIHSKEKDRLHQINTVNSPIDKKVFAREFRAKIKDLASDTFRFAVGKAPLDLIVDLCFESVVRQEESAFSTGLVFAGFGKKQLLPVLYRFNIDGKYRSSLRYWEAHACDFNDSDSSAQIIPFAQSDMFQLFIEGIIGKHIRFIRSTLSNVLKTKSEKMISDYVVDTEQAVVERVRQQKDNGIIVDGFLEEFKKYRRKEIIDPIMTVVNSLPKEEMSAMAEALVELTALRRKVDSQVESVGAGR